MFEYTDGLLNVTVRFWFLSLSVRGRGASCEPRAEPARTLVSPIRVSEQRARLQQMAGVVPRTLPQAPATRRPA